MNRPYSANLVTARCKTHGPRQAPLGQRASRHITRIQTAPRNSRSTVVPQSFHSEISSDMNDRSANETPYRSKTPYYGMDATTALALIQALQAGRIADFVSRTRDLAADERSKGHHGVAQRLIELADKAESTKQTPIVPLEFPVQRPPEPRDTPDQTWIILEPTQTLDQLVLPMELREQLEIFAKELGNPVEMRAWGVHDAPRALLVGAPGTGKTFAALAVAHAARRQMHVLNLDEVFSRYLGETSRNIRRAFDAAAEAGAVLFLDEVDALAKERGDANELGELKRVVNALLQNLDRTREVLPIIAATNHPHLLDQAIGRRFTDIFQFHPPNQEQIVEILRQHLIHIPRKGHFDYPRIAKALSGATGAAIANIVRNAARMAFANSESGVSGEHILKAAALRMKSDAKPSRTQQILALHTEGQSLQHIADQLGVSKTTVWRALHETGPMAVTHG